ncbi:hypothetical protein L917_02083 [Phytophthora nicotianae]|uniref:Uncharacterized protein n=1 Tax=Phytophthora nicotianae TaxID=4792 RepID=W2LXG6_PHYNI|nr:hypothetical protein L917_02083 [Phytophthora nicotianae]
MSRSLWSSVDPGGSKSLRREDKKGDKLGLKQSIGVFSLGALGVELAN